LPWDAEPGASGVLTMVFATCVPPPRDVALPVEWAAIS
jgi:hypothetical protein